MLSALPSVEPAWCYAPRLLIIGQDGIVGSQIMKHARHKGIDLLTGPETDVDLVIGCKFEFGMDEVRRAQAATQPKLASLICPLIPDDAARHTQSAFKQFVCPVWLMYTPTFSVHFRTPQAVAEEALDTSLSGARLNSR
eukprot:6590117-Prymnesium_polylepis.1